MGYNTERQAIEQKFYTTWGTTTRVLWDNDGNRPVEGTEFVRLTIIDGDSTRITLGDHAKSHRSVGIIDIGIFTPIGIGSARARTLADTVSAIFRDEPVFSGILCRSPSITNIGEVDGAWYQMNVRIPFQRDETFV